MNCVRRRGYPGQYLPRDSRIHRLPAGAKAAIAASLAIGGLLAPKPLEAAALAAVWAILYAGARLGWRALAQDSVVVAMQAPLVLLVYFWRDGPAGVSSALMVSARLGLIALPALWLQRTTAVSELGQLLGRFLPDRLSFVAAMGLRFMPLLARDAREIYVLQRMRGARISPRDLVDPRTWPEACHCLAIPLLARALRLADEIAVAAQQRGVYSARILAGSESHPNPFLQNNETAKGLL